MPSKRNCLGIERDQPEIAAKPDQPAADRIGQHASYVKSLRDQDHDQRRQQRKSRDEDKSKAEDDIKCTGINRPGAEIGEFGKTSTAPTTIIPATRAGRQEIRTGSRRGGRSAPWRRTDAVVICEERKRRSNPGVFARDHLDCFASLAMTG